MGEEGPSTTTGPMGCAEIEEEKACADADACIWDGGECIDNPCFHSDCSGAGFEECSAAESCLWIGGEDECFVNGCIPCGAATLEECELADNCMWLEGKGVCESAI